MVKNGVITKFGIIQKLRLLILGMLLLILLSINVAKGEYIEGVHLNSGNVIDYCFMSDNGLYCSNQNIVSIEPGTFKIYSNLISDGTISRVSLEGNSLTRLESGCFEGLENLTYYLDLDYNQLSDIEEGVFYGLENLEELYIDGNENFQLKENMFKGLSGLLWLELWENGIEDIPDGVFNGLDNLEGIDLGGNNLQKIGLGYFNKLNHLIYLNLAYNQISEIEEGAFYGLENLEELYLYGNNISNVDKGIFDDLSKLKELDLGGNRIKSLNLGSISGLTQLESLYLKDNNLTSITGEFNNYSLSYLDISNNCLSKDILDKIAQYLSTLEGFDIDNFYADEEGRMCIDISDEIACPINEYKDGDIKYKVLDCSNKKIKDLTQFKLDEEIKKDIDVLLLYNNEISILKSGVFSGWDNLKILLINNNQLSKIEPGAFEGIALIELYLDNNVIEELDDDLYLNYDRLDYIDISNNDLKCIPYSLYQNIIEYDIDGDSDTSDICYSLSNGKKCTIENGRLEGENNLIPTELDCSNIGLTGLEKGMFSQLDSLEYLELSGNKISKIEKGAFNGLDKLEALSLEGNSLARLESGCFEGLENITYFIDLDYNQLSDIEEGTFNGLENLEELYIDGNENFQLKENMFKGLSGLLWLELWENGIEDVPDGVFNGLDNLEGIVLGGNKLKKIGSGYFNNLSNLKELYLNDNGITRISENAGFNIDSLQHINLGGNELSCMPIGLYTESFNKIMDDELRIEGYDMETPICLNLGEQIQCDLAEEPDYIDDEATVILPFDCTNKGITGINKNMVEEMNYLLNNKFPVIEPIWKDMLDVDNIFLTLDLGGNDFQTIHEGDFNGIEAFSDLLYGLDLSDNQISEIDIKAFEGLENLTWLGLEGNNLSCINEGSVNFIENVFVDDNVDIGMCVEGGSCTTYEETDEYDENIKYKVLDCSEGNITTITSEMFYGFSDIDRLYLNDNQISKIEDGAFDGLDSISYIDLSNNKINSFSDTIFENLDDFTSINLSNNTISKVKMYNNGDHLYTVYIDFSGNCINNEYIYDGSPYHYYDNQKMCIKETYSCKYGCESGVDVKLKVIGNLNIDDLGLTKALDEMNPLHFSKNGDGYIDINNINIDGNLGEYISNLPLDGLIPVNVDRIGKYDDIVLSSDNLLKVCDFNWDVDNDNGPHSIYSQVENNLIIDCSNRNIVEIKENTFDVSMNGLYGNTIYLNNNKIQKIEGLAFNNLYMTSSRGVNKIYLNNNLITNIKTNTFNNVTLDVGRSGIGNFIYLNDNNISNIENMAFDGLSMNGNSNHIYLNDNKISNIKNDAFKGAYFCRGLNTDVE